MLALEVRRPVEEIAPAKGGKTQGAVVGRSAARQGRESRPRHVDVLWLWRGCCDRQPDPA